MGYKDLGNNWNRKWLDDIKAMLKELYSGAAPIKEDAVGNKEIRDNSISTRNYVDGSLTTEKMANDSVDITKTKSKKIYNILSTNYLDWNTFRIDFSLGNKLVLNPKNISDKSFFYKGQPAVGLYSNFIEIDSNKIFLYPTADIYIGIIEFDINGLCVKDSGWQTKQSEYTLQSNTKKIIVALRKKVDKDFWDLSGVSDRKLLKQALVCSENTQVNHENKTTGNSIGINKLDFVHGLYEFKNGEKIVYKDNNSRIVLKDIIVNPHDEYIITFNDKFNISIVMLDENDDVLNSSPWFSNGVPFKPHSLCKKITIMFKYLTDSQMTLSEIHNFDLEITNILEQIRVNEVVEQINLMSDYTIDCFENGTFVSVTTVGKEKVRRANVVGRARLIYPVKLEKGHWYQFDVQCPDEFRYSLQVCNDNDFHIFDTGWFEGRYHYYAETDSYVFMLFKNNDNDSITVEDIKKFTFNVFKTEREQRLFFKDAYNFYAAHRGANEFAPENTIASVLEAKKYGFDFVEFDVQLTKDLVPIIMHDDTVDRMTNGTGKIRELDYSYIKTLKIDAGNGLDNYPNEIVPTFEEMLNRCKIDRIIPLVHFNVMKDLTDCDVILDVLRKLNMIDKVFMVAPGNEAMMRIKKRETNLIVARLLVDYDKNYPDIRRMLCHENTAVASWFLPDSNNSKEWISSLKKHGVLFNGYVVNEKYLSDTAFSTGIDLVTTDKSNIINN